MYICGHRMFLVPRGFRAPAGDSLVSRTDGTHHRVDLAALEPYEVDSDASVAWQKAELADSMRRIGEVGDLLGELLTKGNTAGKLQPGELKAGLARLRAAAEGLQAEADGAQGIADQVARKWDGPGARAIADAVVAVTKDADEE
jgi:hypothetical protein